MYTMLCQLKTNKVQGVWLPKKDLTNRNIIK